MSEHTIGCTEDGMFRSLLVDALGECEIKITSKSRITDVTQEDTVLIRIDSGATSRSLSLSPIEAKRLASELDDIASEIQDRR